MATVTVVGGFALALDRSYHPETHMWVLVTGPGRRVGMGRARDRNRRFPGPDSTLVPVGTQLEAGRPFGQMEAAKFVGPLVSPVRGVVAAVNGAAVADAGVLEQDPYGLGWLIEADLGNGADPGRGAGLLSDPDEISAWFTAKIASYRDMGVIAE